MNVHVSYMDTNFLHLLGQTGNNAKISTSIGNRPLITHDQRLESPDSSPVAVTNYSSDDTHVLWPHSLAVHRWWQKKVTHFHVCNSKRIHRSVIKPNQLNHSCTGELLRTARESAVVVHTCNSSTRSPGRRRRSLRSVWAISWDLASKI